MESPRPPVAIPPHDIGAERAVLGAILLEGRQAIEKVQVLKPSDFLVEANRSIYAAMLDLYAGDMPIDMITVPNALDRAGKLYEVGGPAALALLEHEASILVNLPAYAEIVREKAFRRELLQMAMELERQAKDPVASTEGLSRLVHELGEVAKERASQSSRIVWDIRDLSDLLDDVEPVKWIIEGLIRDKTLGLIGGAPKKGKSLLMFNIALAIACGREKVAQEFEIRERPGILYVSLEDGLTRFKARRDDILRAWNTPGAEPAMPKNLHLAYRPKGFDLLNPEHVAKMREICLEMGLKLVILDTWTRSSPTADPLGAQDQARLMDIMTQFRHDIEGSVWIVDHTRKNRPDSLQGISSADIFGPIQKWAAADQLVVLAGTEKDPYKIEVFIEGRDIETTRFFLIRSERGSMAEKFVYAGSVDEMAEATQLKALGRRDMFWRAAIALGRPAKLEEIRKKMQEPGYGAIVLEPRTAQRYADELKKYGRMIRDGQGKNTLYTATTDSRSSTSCRESDERQGKLA